MEFYEVLEKVIELLQRHGRVTYRALKLQFKLEDEALEALKDELFFAHPVVDEAGQREPLSYTPQHLAEKILTTRSALEGERKQVTVMFCDIKDSTELICDLNPEAAQQLLDPAIHIMMDAVHRFEGTVNQVLGDGIMALLGDAPSLEPIKKLLIERTEGNPFFLEESVRTMVETQVLVGESGAYCLTQGLPTIEVPATVQAILAARIDRLSQDEKRLLQTASVIGSEVPFPLLQTIAEVPEESLHRSLIHLQAAEFLYETNLFPERMYIPSSMR